MSTRQPPSNSRLRYQALCTTHQSAASLWDAPRFLLALLILSYMLYFSWYSLNRHNTLHSYAADLSLIDQPLWNTVRGPGGFMELTWGQRQQPRLAEHFEPLLVPLALLFYLWDDVGILLIAQTVALALGALPVYWIARQQFSQLQLPLPKEHPATNLPSWAALAFAAAYLLYPQLQAANIADFHADPFVVAPLLFAFWYAIQQRWGWMWLWAIIAMSTKETLPPLTAMLGMWLIITTFRQQPAVQPPHPSDRQSSLPVGPQTAVIAGSDVAGGGQRPALIHGLALILISTAWFLSATYLIVAPLAKQYFGSAGPIYFASRYPLQEGLSGLVTLLQDPLRWRYLLGLLAAVGFLPLLAPELLLLGLPVLVANLLSNFPGQYSGEQHYSAPLAVAFVVAAIIGARRLINASSLCENNGQSYRLSTMINVCLWLLAWSLSYHALHGWTPLSLRTETYPLTPAAVRLPHLLTSIPLEAVVSASAAIHPHLAHRRVIYVFPTVQEADYVLVDVTDIPGVHPNDAQAKLMHLLNTNWRILQADQGLILAQKLNESTNSFSSAPLLPSEASRRGCSPALKLPCSFFDFARATTAPTYPTQLAFGDGRLRLRGFDVHDDPDNGVTFRFYWQATAPLPDKLRLWPLIYDDQGQLLSDPAQAPLLALLWYPPAAWQPHEIVVSETLPQLLPDTFHLGLAVGPEGSLADSSQRYPVIPSPSDTSLPYLGHWVQLASFQRRASFLQPLVAMPTLQPLASTQVSFGPALRLTGFRIEPDKLRPGGVWSILLRWTATQPPASDYTVFIHLLGPNGQRVAQSDAFPTWLTLQPTSQWPLHQPILDSHHLTLPADLAPGVYTVQLGLYNLQTQERLLLPDGGDVYILGQVQFK